MDFFLVAPLFLPFVDLFIWVIFGIVIYSQHKRIKKLEEELSQK